MIDISSLTSGAVQGATAPGATPAARTPAATDAIEKFNAAMDTPAGPPPDQNAGHANPVDGTQAATAPQEPAPIAPVGQTSPGDAILGSLEKMSSNFNGAMDQVGRSLAQANGSLSTADLMRMQYSLTQVTMQQDMLGKVVGKATQNLDTFLKNQ